MCAGLLIPLIRDHLASGDDGQTVTFSVMKSASSSLPSGGSFSSSEELKDIVVYIPLGGNQDPAPRVHYCFLTTPHLSLHPLLSLISNCLNLPFGTQGRGYRKSFVPRSPIGSY